MLSSALNEECSLEVVQTVHDQLRQSIEMHKESKIPDPLLVSKEDVKDVLSSCGVSEQHVAKFSVDYDEAFGFEAQLHPKNIIDNKRFEIKTPDVSIKVAPDRTDLIETRVIGGVKYILICADESVEVNGVSINIKEDWVILQGGRFAPACEKYFEKADQYLAVLYFETSEDGTYIYGVPEKYDEYPLYGVYVKASVLEIEHTAVERRYSYESRLQP